MVLASMIYRKNQILTTTIEDMGTDGEGIGKTDGYTLFVKDALLGDTVSVKLTKVKKNYAYARLEKVITPSSFRINPPCAYSRTCGGCQIQALRYDEQLRFKERKVKNNLIRLGGFSADEIEMKTEPIIGMEEPWRYRNKAQYPIGKDKNGKFIAGFYAGRTHDIIANVDCLLGVKENEAILQKVLAYMEENKVLPYDEQTHTGLVRHVLIRKGFVSGQLMVCVVINGKKLPAEDKLSASLMEIKNMTSVSLSINTNDTNVIMGNEIRVLAGKPVIEDVLGGIKFAISPLSFYQVNPVQTEKLYGKALEFADLHGNETVWDLYCGIGTISLFLAQKAGKVYGVEIVPEAIADAKINAQQNAITNAEFYVGKAEEVLPAFYEKAAAGGENTHADVIVVDPPRKGCDEICLDTMLKMQPDRIVYVSCDSATLARDLKVLCEGGYELKKMQCVDMFPMTVHVETVVLMSKVK